MAEPHEGVGFRAIAYSVMQKAYNDGMAQRKTSDQIAADIDAAYPWQIPRQGHRYKCWKAVRREFFKRHSLPGLRPAKPIQRLAQKLLRSR
ncbi:hypothetical protein [uncultured Cedecea sp.]|uniref:hypothetical protein n=1 Tax=uncultured Cedecea sp. TaxID=988762 RepID=UPI00263519BC|nr:hypothetical protein [uncultured Cedecea sp.]